MSCQGYSRLPQAPSAGRVALLDDLVALRGSATARWPRRRWRPRSPRACRPTSAPSLGGGDAHQRAARRSSARCATGSERWDAEQPGRRRLAVRAGTARRRAAAPRPGACRRPAGPPPSPRRALMSAGRSLQRHAVGEVDGHHVAVVRRVGERAVRPGGPVVGVGAASGVSRPAPPAELARRRSTRWNSRNSRGPAAVSPT